MIPIAAALYILQAVSPAAAAQVPGADDRVPVARRLTATTQLAAQEYRLGVQQGRVISREELSEARLFLTEARRTAALLPLDDGKFATTEVDAVARLMDATADPDSVSVRVARLGAALAARLGVSLEDIPTQIPVLARGAQVYQTECASCHGLAGRGDGPAAAGLTPPPANLTDPVLLRDRSPLDFYRRISIGGLGTSMPAFEARLPAEDRWAVAVYASLLRLPAPRGEVPPALRAFPTTSRMSDAQLAQALDAGNALPPAQQQSRVAAVRSYQDVGADAARAGEVFARVRVQLDSALALARAGESAGASSTAFDAYMTFEEVERTVRARNPALASELEAAFASFRTRAAGGATSAELGSIHRGLLAGLENAERVIGDRLSPLNLFLQSFVILLREGLEAILVIGALMAFLVKTGAARRRRDIHIGVGAALAASVVTAVVLETLFQITPGRREALEGATMIVATAMLFYVSYWLLSKMEVVKWNRFVKSKVQDALTSGSALALVSVAFLAVYREGFETVLFYKALFLTSGGAAGVLPLMSGIAAGAVVLGVVYFAINRYGVKIPLRPFFGVTSAFLYYMAFVFAGKGIAELQEGGLMSTTMLEWAPRVPALGIYPTLESLSLQALLLALLLFALLWTFVIEPRRLAVTASLVPEPGATPAPPVVPAGEDRDLIRSLERMDADLAELRAEVARIKSLLSGSRSSPGN